MEEQEVVKKGVEILFRELGPVEASRFINISAKGVRVEGVKRHREWQEKLNKDVFSMISSKTNKKGTWAT
jgi:hypothetical protein